MDDNEIQSEFEALLDGAGFEAQAFDPEALTLADTGGVMPPDIDDHTAWHLFEGIVQLIAALDAEEFIVGMNAGEIDGIDEVFEEGLHWYIAGRWGNPQGPEAGTAQDIDEFMPWVRVASGFCVLNAERFLAVHGLRKIVIPVYLTGHGWQPLMLTSGILDDEE